MSPYETALRRYRQARTASQAAPGDAAAAAELEAARRFKERFAIDPEYNPDRQKVTA